MVKHKLKEWLKRYWLAEIIGLAMVLLVSNLVKFASGSIILAAFLGTWSENITFYGIITYKDLKLRKQNHGQISFWGFFKVFRNIVIEFGPAEYLDSFVIRPFYMILFPYLIPNYSLAILIASVLANITYYIPAIISYELRKKVLKD